MSWTFLLLCLSATVALAQPSLSLNGSVFPAGPDFATDVHHDPWDFNNIDDLSPFPDEQLGWLSSAQARSAGRGVFLNNGRFQGTTDTTGGNKISLLYRGGAGLVNTGRTGAFDRMAVRTASYGKLAIKMRLTNPGPPPNQLFGIWYHRTMGQADEQNNAGMVLFGAPTNGWALYIVDLQTRQFVAADGSLQTGQLASPFGATAATWNASSLVRGFELRAQGSAGYSVPVEVDWVRLTARDGLSNTANMSVTYANCSGAYTLRITDSESVPFAVARGTASGAGTITFNYGILAPGAYTATLTCNNGASAAQPFTVNSPPMVTVIDPDITGGADFATDVLGNPWDMADAADVPQINDVTNIGSVEDAGVAALQATGTASGDPQVTLLNGGSALLNTRRYRRLTFTLTLDTPFGLNGAVGEGSLARVLWGSQATQYEGTMTTSNDLLAWPGRVTYSIDLSTLSAANGGLETECAACQLLPWTQHSVRFFRIDPHESTRGVRFRLAQVKLAAVDEVALGSSFNVRYRVDDGDSGSTYRAQFYLDGDHDPSSGLQLMGTVNNVPVGAELTFPMTATGVSPGVEFNVYVRVTETHTSGMTQTRGAYSGGPLRVYATSSSLPRLTIANPAPSSPQQTPFTVSGCAYDEGNTSGINVDEVAVLALAGADVTGIQAGTTQVLGFGGSLGTRTFPIACPTASGPFSNAGFAISGISGLSVGNWTLRVMSRSTISGLFTTREVPFRVATGAGTPVNFAATASGNSVTVSFGAPTTGTAVGGYVVEGAFNPNFAPAAFNVFVPSAGTYSGSLANGTYYLRVVSLHPGGARMSATAGQQVLVGPAPPTAPGAPSLSLAQAVANPVTLNWSPGAGGTPASYTVYAGTSPGSSNLAVAPMGGATGLTAVAPVGTPIYVRVVATNAAGSATSNEVQFTVMPPAVPGVPTLSPASVSGSNVTLSWAPPASGGSPTGYVIRARLPGSAAVVAALPVTGTSVTVPAGPGTYLVTITAVNGAGSSAESNQITVIVP